MSLGPSSVPFEHVAFYPAPEAFEATIHFYEDVFGWRRVRERSDGRTVFLSDGRGAVFEIIRRQGGVAAAKLPAHLAFAVALEEFDALRRRLVEAGTAGLTDVGQSEFGSSWVFFEDPAGNACQLVGRADSDRLDMRWYAMPAPVLGGESR